MHSNPLKLNCVSESTYRLFFTYYECTFITVWNYVFLPGNKVFVSNPFAEGFSAAATDSPNSMHQPWGALWASVDEDAELSEVQGLEQCFSKFSGHDPHKEMYFLCHTQYTFSWETSSTNRIYLP